MAFFTDFMPPGWALALLISWGIGAFFCTITFLRKNRQGTIVGFIGFFILPVVLLGIDTLKQQRIYEKFMGAEKEVARLCANDGGDKIYRTVSGVKGVFQMRARKAVSKNVSDNSDKNSLDDQYGMFDPYGWAQGDRNKIDEFVGGAIRFGLNTSSDKPMYWFFEQQPEYGLPEGPPYKRSIQIDRDELLDQNSVAGKAYRSQGVFQQAHPKTIQSQQRQSRYGYITEDITTKAMRDAWIGAGRIKIIDLKTQEVFAVRTGYYKATGRYAERSKPRWTDGYYQSCPVLGEERNSQLVHFIQSVLEPVKGYPNSEQLQVILEE